jgi:hypothetical protein
MWLKHFDSNLKLIYCCSKMLHASSVNNKSIINYI